MFTSSVPFSLVKLKRLHLVISSRLAFKLHNTFAMGQNFSSKNKSVSTNHKESATSPRADITVIIGADLFPLFDPEFGQSKIVPLNPDINLAPPLNLHKEVPAGKLFFEELLPLLRNGLLYEYGLEIPGITIQGSVEIASDHFEIQHFENKVFRGRIQKDAFVCKITEEELDAQNIPWTTITCSEPWHFNLINQSAFWISESYKKTSLLKDRSCWDAQEFLIVCLATYIKKNLHHFCSVQKVYELVQNFKNKKSAILIDLILKKYDLVDLTLILRKILKAGLPIQNLEEIFETLLIYKKSRFHFLTAAQTVIRNLRKKNSTNS